MVKIPNEPSKLYSHKPAAMEWSIRDGPRYRYNTLNAGKSLQDAPACLSHTPEVAKSLRYAPKCWWHKHAKNIREALHTNCLHLLYEKPTYSRRCLYQPLVVFGPLSGPFRTFGLNTKDLWPLRDTPTTLYNYQMVQNINCPHFRRSSPNPWWQNWKKDYDLPAKSC